MFLLYPLIGKIFEKMFGGRGDGSPALTYFTADDYGVRSRPFSFLSGKNLLRGEAYFVDESPKKGLVVFFHGLSAGRSSYTSEIAYLAKAGYLVMAYDNTGCMQSEGASMNGLSQAVLDQKAFFEFLDKQEEIKGMPRFAIGHSWGGYLAFMATNPLYRVKKAVSVAGFFSVDTLCVSAAPKAKGLQKTIRGYIAHRFGKDAAKSGLDYVKESGIPVLYVQGDRDFVVPTKDHYGYLKKHAKEYPNVTLRLQKNRAHQAFWTEDGQAYYDRVFGKRGEKKFTIEDLLAIDYSEMNVDDPKLMKAIVDFFGE